MAKTGHTSGPAVDVWLWPDCLPAWAAWQAVQTQWRHSASGGITGLCYAGVRAWLCECGPTSRAQRREFFEAIQACESATLQAWAQHSSSTP